MNSSADTRSTIRRCGGQANHYGYDDLYRLTGEVRTGSHPYQTAFTYDNVGNRLTQVRDSTTTSYVYNDRDQLTVESTGAASSSYGYDAAGRMVSKTDAGGTTTYGWLDNDRMVSVSGPAIFWCARWERRFIPALMLAWVKIIPSSQPSTAW